METVQEPLPRCFIYGLVDPETRLVFYVGQTISGAKRFVAHRRRGWNFDIAVLDLVDEPQASVVALCPWLPLDRKPTAINELERFWIAFGRACGWPLRNRTDGGEGMRIDGAPETRARMSASQLGKKHDEATKEKISAAIKARMATPGVNLGNAGRRASLNGERFGCLLVEREAGDRRWICHCDCGRTRTVTTSALRRGLVVSCGCLGRDERDERKAVRFLVLAVARLVRPRPHRKRAVATHCKHGHALVPDNLRVRGGLRICKACDANTVRRWKHGHRDAVRRKKRLYKQRRRARDREEKSTRAP